MGLSKLALHVVDDNDGAIEAIDGLTNPQFIKVMSLSKPICDALIRLRQRCPTVMIGYRHYFEDSLNTDLSKWQVMCDTLSNAVLNSSAADIIELVFTPFNEQFMLIELGLEKYVDTLPMMASRIKANFRQRGKGMRILVAGGNFPATTPRLNEWEIVKKCFSSLDFISVHEYAQPSMDCLPEVLYAHEKVIENYPDMPPIIISETGIDHALYTTPPDYNGWQENLKPEQYATQLDDYHCHISGNDKVYAAAVFQIGSYDTRRWGSYGINNPIVLACFNKSFSNKKFKPVKDAGMGKADTWHKDQVGEPEHKYTYDELSGTRNWVPNDLSKTFTDWRFTEGNHWPPHTDVERKEFWAHCGRLGIDIAKYMSKSTTVDRPDNYMVSTFAHLMDVDEVLLYAILSKESAGKAFGPRGMPIMRVEAHLVLRNTHDKSAMNKIIRVKGPNSWQGHQYFNYCWSSYHGDQQSEQKVLASCSIPDSEASYRGTSFGLFQIRGEHYQRLGFNTAEEMANDMKVLENQYFAFALFCATGGCLSALREHRIEDFVKEYNGVGLVKEYSNYIRAYIKRMG